MNFFVDADALVCLLASCCGPPALLVGLRHVLDQVDDTVGITVFVVIPAMIRERILGELEENYKKGATTALTMRPI